jgi:hypothetical protein
MHEIIQTESAVNGPMRYVVITADVVGSRKIDSFSDQRDFKLNAVSKLHLEKRLILSPYAVTAWDEFQVIIAKPEHTPRVIFDLRRLLFPFALRIAVGMGAATGADRQPINRYAGGEAFERARVAADRLRSESPKYRVFTSFESGNEKFDTIANTIYRLQDSLIERRTAKQWAAVNMYLETGSLEITAERLRVDSSTVSRSLKRGYYWHQIETVGAMERIVKMYVEDVRFDTN